MEAQPSLTRLLLQAKKTFCSRFCPKFTCNHGRLGFSVKSCDVAQHDDYFTAFSICQADKTVSTIVGSLPVSPLMDPKYHEAKQKFKSPKKAEPLTRDKTKFQRLLERNPFALMLATPVRSCNQFSLLLPRAFLQSFKVVTHPETKLPLWIPDERCPGASGSHGKPGAHTYLCCQHDFYAGLGTDWKRALRARHENVPPERARAVWRADMATRFLESLRRSVVHRLLHLAVLVEEQSRDYVRRCTTWDEAKSDPHRGCLLWLGQSPAPESADASSAWDAIPPAAPPCLSAMQIDGVRHNGKLLVHNLQELLGQEHVDHLRRESGLWQKGTLFLLKKRRTLELQILLWKLQGYKGENLK